MSDQIQKKFNLAWHQHEHYCILVFSKHHQFDPGLLGDLSQAGMKPQPVSSGGHPVMGISTDRNWREAWHAIYEVIATHNADAVVEVVLSPGRDMPDEGSVRRQSVAAVQAIADSMWLGDALLENRIMCYLQPVLSGADKVFGYESFARVAAPSGADKVFGYESFARVAAPDGAVIAGDRIVKASKALGIEYMIDRHLQVQAIKTFMSSQFNGFLFINFFPGFIHRPAVYLEGLAETVRSFGVLPKNIVLDFTNSETPYDIMHLKNVCEYARSCGYSIALDDMESLKSMQRLFPEIKPDFVKIDMRLVHKLEQEPVRETVRGIIDMAHNANATVIGEGVETDDMFQQLKIMGVDLFQGYLFSPPLPVDVALARSTG